MRQHRNLRASDGCVFGGWRPAHCSSCVAITPQPRPDRALCTPKAAGSRARYHMLSIRRGAQQRQICQGPRRPMPGASRASIPRKSPGGPRWPACHHCANQIELYRRKTTSTLSFSQAIVTVFCERGQQITEHAAGARLYFHRDRHSRRQVDQFIVDLHLRTIE
jgi:hypothetical protein